jgi:fructosamine-3-kinase
LKETFKESEKPQKKDPVQPDLQRSLSEGLGSPVAQVMSLSGGDINDAYRVALEDGREVFVKANTRLQAAVFEAEARGLRWLAEPNALRIPKVLLVASDADPVPFLVLELLKEGRRQKDFDEELGRGLATLHGATPAGFGLDYDNWIGSLPQRNTPASNWASFYREHRLAPQVERAKSSGALPGSTVRDFERLYAVLSDRVGEPEPPARLHGDLWGGNLHIGPNGEPCLIDPACYGGHREVDLALMRLFGGFSPRVFDAYDEAYPLQPDSDERVPLYQLYPLLVHVNLFGGGYAQSVAAALRRIL